MSISRREILSSAAIAGGYVLAGGARALARSSIEAQASTTKIRDASAGDYTPVGVPNGWTLPYTLVDGAKVFHLVAEEIDHEFTPGLSAKCWGYNGSVHGPVIEAVEGDHIRIFVTNKLTAATTIHWHGLLVPSGMDGVSGLNQKRIEPGETYLYEFTLRQHGTLMYHSHHDEMTQMGLGMTGLFVIHPRAPQGPRPDRDFAIMLHEWRIDPGTDRPDPNEMTDFNIFTMNGRVFPGTAPLVVKQGDRVRIRLGNLGAMDHHPIHLHGYSFKITETGGGPIPESAQWPDNTVLVAVGETRTIEFIADNPGDWAFHCHMTHHGMNQMGHGLPNMIGVKGESLDAQMRPLLPAYMTMGTGGMADMGQMGMAVPKNSIPMLGGDGPQAYITMGGMFTVLKVRETLPDDAADPGWYHPPAGTLAVAAGTDTLQHNNIPADASTAPRRPGSARARLPEALQTHPDAPSTQPNRQLYTCVMHPEVITDAPGKCPKCGMTLVPKK